MNRETQLVLQEVENERSIQDARWGEHNHTPIEWISILLEKVGEAAQQANQHHWVPQSSPTYQRDKLQAYRAELLQVAAVAVAAIEALNRGTWRK